MNDTNEMLQMLQRQMGVFNWVKSFIYLYIKGSIFKAVAHTLLRFGAYIAWDKSTQTNITCLYTFWTKATSLCIILTYQYMETIRAVFSFSESLNPVNNCEVIR